MIDEEILIEQFDQMTIKRDKGLEEFARMMVNPSIGKTLKIQHTPEMGELRVISMVNDEGHTEFHIHNNNAMPGTSAPHDTITPFKHAVSIIHNDAANVIASGGSVQLQTIGDSTQMKTYKKIAERLASKAGKQIIDGGVKPLTSAPFLSGPTIIIK